MLIQPAQASVTATTRLVSGLFTAPADTVQTAVGATADALHPVAAFVGPLSALLGGTAILVVGTAAYLYADNGGGGRP